MKMTDTSKSLMVHVCLISVVIFVISIFVIRALPSVLFFGLGIFLGALLSFGRIYLMERTLNKTLDLASADANLYARSQFLVRYVLTGVILVGAAFVSPFSLYGAAFGLFTLQLAAYWISMKGKKK